MRLLTLLAGVLLAIFAFADDSKEFRVNRIEMAATAPEPVEETTDAKDEAEQTRAQDYNSSRSNNINAADTDDDSGDEDDAVDKTESEVKDQRK